MPLSPPSFDYWIIIQVPLLLVAYNTTNSYGDLTNYNLIVKQKIASIPKKNGLFQKS
jgi:hypothetical protein